MAATTLKEGLQPGPVVATWPSAKEAPPELPEQARRYLEQALASLAAPDGAAMLAASSIDAMLKAKGLAHKTLFDGIKEAEAKHLITADMAEWAHAVRLGANDPRHANGHHDADSARNLVDFATALAEILFVLPGRVARGKSEAEATQNTPASSPPTSP